MAPTVRVNGSHIRKLREEQGLERGELAERVGISSHRLYVVEVYKQTTRPSTLRRIAEALDVSPKELIA